MKLMSDIISDANILVTGGAGLIGSHVIELLIRHGAKIRTVTHEHPIPKEFGKVKIIKGDLIKWETCQDAVRDIDYVIHTAAFVGGVGRYKTHPALMFTPNILINTQLLEAARLADVKRYVYTSSVAVYGDTNKLLEEEKCWIKSPEPTSASYGWMKRMGEFQAQMYQREYGMKIAIVRPTNAYGPRDNFDLESSHVVAALVRKAVERHNPYIVWGTGSEVRDFIHARDIAQGMMLALEKYTVADPVNLASGQSITISELVRLILRISGHTEANIKFDNARSGGPKKRYMSTRKAKEKMGFSAKISLEAGLKETIDWYKNKLAQAI